MNATMSVPPHDQNFPGSMKLPVTVSLVFHAAVILLMIFGLPHIAPSLPVMDIPIPVEMVTIDDMNRTNVPDARMAEKKMEEKPVEEPPKPQAPTVTSATPPKPAEPEKPKPAEPEEAAAQEDDVAPPEKKPEKPKEKDAPKPPRRPVLTKTDEAQEKDFQSLLKNLTPEQAAAQQSQGTAAGEKPSFLAALGDQVTMTELQALQAQFRQCWNLAAGARYAEDLVVDVRIYVNPDRTVRNAEVVDQFRYNTDSFFRAAADSALRATRHPYCNPLDLPPDKYEQWKVMIFQFDPRQML